MDSITQATLGAAIGEAMLGKKAGKKGAVLGAIIATVPDLDVVLLPFYDDLQRLSIHRGYSHSILFSLFGAILIAIALSRIKWTKQFSYLKLFSFGWLVLFTHMLLDAFTTYGTQLLLPFSKHRVSFDSINIVDPVYTIPLLTGVLLCNWTFKKNPNRRFYNQIGIIISTIYLISTLGIKTHVNYKFDANLQNQKISYNDLLTVPVKSGSIHWYGVAKSDNSLFIGKYNNLKRNQISFTEFPINDHLLNDIDVEIASTLKWFSKDFYTVAKYNGKVRLYNMQCDMQGIRTHGKYKAPTAFYFEIETDIEGNYKLSTGMHQNNTK